ncbi:MAG: hypothetical protein M5R36_00830 [Deltaproteobacteria bacterium]|nr:hypothetical protein [Deltaproteobacteria bacterium]
MNSATLALAIGITERANPIRFWIKNFLPTGIGYLTCGSIATLLFMLHGIGHQLGYLVWMPMAALVYFFQKVYLQKGGRGGLSHQRA